MANDFSKIKIFIKSTSTMYIYSDFIVLCVIFLISTIWLSGGNINIQLFNFTFDNHNEDRSITAGTTARTTQKENNAVE